MSLKDSLKKAADGIKETGEKLTQKVEHTVSEAIHHVAADSEQEKRKVMGDQLTPEEYVDSMANEAKHRVQGGIDEVKKKFDDV